MEPALCVVGAMYVVVATGSGCTHISLRAEAISFLPTPAWRRAHAPLVSRVTMPSHTAWPLARIVRCTGEDWTRSLCPPISTTGLGTSVVGPWFWVLDLGAGLRPQRSHLMVLELEAGEEDATSRDLLPASSPVAARSTLNVIQLFLAPLGTAPRGRIARLAAALVRGSGSCINISTIAFKGLGSANPQVHSPSTSLYHRLEVELEANMRSKNFWRALVSW
mmetsp:Transcript_16337/g.31369  ORF Transcript_16337/g.31369 Transcript_16337/m.31369 type:complete len:221 (-) Transcript_16337:829-1491(-)